MKVDKLKHFAHPEDLPIQDYHGGFKHAFNTLDDAHRLLMTGKSEKTSLVYKSDGSPSVVFGTHPETHKFFVSTKSAFNKEPKINYTPEDIEKNHGHAPGLVKRLKHALEHLPKVTPPGNVYQGDIMHTPEDTQESGGNVQFKPNTLTYGAAKNSKIGQRVKDSKVGIVVHTKYEGKTFDSLKAKHSHIPVDFGEHKDVHVMSPHVDVKKVKPDHRYHSVFTHHMAQAVSAYDPKLQSKAFKEHQHSSPGVGIESYINKTVREGGRPDTEGYMNHYRDRHLTDMEKLKMNKTKESRRQSMDQGIDHIKKNKEAFDSLFKVHRHIQAAKHAMVDALDSHPYYFKVSSPEGESHPEGYVVSRSNMPLKLVRRDRFSRMNLNRDRSK